MCFCLKKNSTTPQNVLHFLSLPQEWFELSNEQREAYAKEASVSSVEMLDRIWL